MKQFWTVALGVRLRELRGTRSQQDVARDMGVAPSTLSHFETGAREPSLSQLVDLANVYGVTLVHLLAPVDFGEPAAQRDLLPFDDGESAVIDFGIKKDVPDHVSESSSFAAWVRPTRSSDEFIWQHLGKFPDEYNAKEAVRLKVRAYGLRCLFRWEGNLYRCSPKESGVWGRIEKA